MKKFLGIAAGVLAAGMTLTLAGCGGCTGCNGCNGKTKNNALTNSNWFNGTGFKGIQPFFIVEDNPAEYTKEILTYDVTFDKESASNKSYSVDYKDGTFVTEFYATRYKWDNANIPEDYRNDKTEVVYYYKTELEISVQYKKGENSSEWFNDSVVTESYFRAAEYNLQPVYSKQTVKSTSPNGFQTNKLENAYFTVDCVYENFYNYGFTEVTSVTHESGKDAATKVHGGINKHRNTVFDNSSLYTAVRSMKLSNKFSQNIDLFSAAAGGFSTYAVAGADTELSAEEKVKVSDALAAKGLYTKAAEDDKGVSTVAMNIGYNGSDLHGTSQTVWYAAIENANNNVARTTMLKLSIPVSYGLGTLNYTLKEVNSTLWNK